jgi:oligoribonuclease NrnB/cAMP/cGMP phosphodiesterase (DHH superfamily)
MYLTHDSFDFKDVVEACKDKVVYVGDFSFTKDELEELTKVTKSIIVIDHHLSAFESIGDLDYVHIDLEKSGARLAWEFFFPRADRVPILIALIEDRDLWNFFYDKEDTNALVLALKSERDLNFKTLIEDEDAVTDLIGDYSSVLEYIENEDLKYSKKVDDFMFFRTSFVGINTNLPSSNILNLASKEHSKPALSYNIEKINGINNIKISMRNHKLGLVMEWKVGAGKLLVCMSDLEKAAKYPEGKAFYQSVIDYMRSVDFNPQVEMTASDLLKTLKEEPRKVSLKELNNISQY